MNSKLSGALSKLKDIKDTLSEIRIGPGGGPLVSVGLDIGSRYIKMVVLKKTGMTAVLQKYAIKELPADSIVNKEIMDREIVQDTIRSLLDECGILTEMVVVNIGGSGVIIKKINVSPMSDKELAESISMFARDNIPFDLADVSWDYKILRKSGEMGQMELLISAAKHDSVYGLIDILKNSGTPPIIIDIDSLALQNALTYNKYLPKPGNVALINVGFETSSVILFKDGIYTANREIPVAEKVYIEALMRFLDLEFDDASQALRGEGKAEIDPEDVSGIAGSITEKMVEHIERVFPIFYSKEDEEKLNHIYLSGGGSRIVNLRGYLENRYNIPVEIVNPLNNIKYPQEVLSSQEAEKIGPVLSTAIGLALRRIERFKVDINLLPPEERVPERRAPLSLLEAISILLPILLVVGYSITRNIDQKRDIKEMESKLASLKVEQAKIKKDLEILREIEEKRAVINKKVELARTLSKGVTLPVRVLDEINRLIPSDMWLTDLNIEEEGGLVTLKGSTSNVFKVADIIRDINENNLFNDVELSYIRKQFIQGRMVASFELKFRIIS